MSLPSISNTNTDNLLLLLMSTLTLLTLDMNMHDLLACAFVDILENITHGYTALETYLLWFIFSYDRNTLSVVL